MDGFPQVINCLDSFGNVVCLAQDKGCIKVFTVAGQINPVSISHFDHHTQIVRLEGNTSFYLTFEGASDGEPNFLIGLFLLNQESGGVMAYLEVTIAAITRKSQSFE